MLLITLQIFFLNLYIKGKKESKLLRQKSQSSFLIMNPLHLLTSNTKSLISALCLPESVWVFLCMKQCLKKRFFHIVLHTCDSRTLEVKSRRKRSSKISSYIISSRLAWLPETLSQTTKTEYGGGVGWGRRTRPTRILHEIGGKRRKRKDLRPS